MSAVDYANESGCVVFFDPGPRGKSLFNGLQNQQLALNKLLNLSDVLLLTSDEVSYVADTLNWIDNAEIDLVDVFYFSAGTGINRSS